MGSFPKSKIILFSFVLVSSFERQLAKEKAGAIRSIQSTIDCGNAVIATLIWRPLRPVRKSIVIGFCGGSIQRFKKIESKDLPCSNYRDRMVLYRFPAFHRGLKVELSVIRQVIGSLMSAYKSHSDLKIDWWSRLLKSTWSRKMLLDSNHWNYSAYKWRNLGLDNKLRSRNY